jgi:hypothetical protein
MIFTKHLANRAAIRQTGIEQAARVSALNTVAVKTAALKPVLRSALLGTSMLCTFALCPTAHADEIRLKDGTTLYGVFVSLDGNMYKVRTPFGYLMVEKDKIAEIIPTTDIAEPKPGKASAKKDSAAAARKNAVKTAQDAERDTPPPDAANAASSDESPANADATAGGVTANTEDSAAAKREKTAAIIANTAVKPQVPTTTPKKVVAPALRANSAPVVTDAALVRAVPAPVAPKEPDTPPEEIHGNLYVNHANNFSIYKAPSWNLIEDARKALPNAIVAMGTQNESTLLVVGKEKTGKQALEPAADAVEHRVREVYENYRQISRRSTTVAGQPGMEYRFRGVADDHDWSGTLVVLTRGADTFTILGMTFAESDLIQIQENVISRAIASLKFSAQ